jgi:hypothetical protein
LFFDATAAPAAAAAATVAAGDAVVVVVPTTTVPVVAVTCAVTVCVAVTVTGVGGGAVAVTVDGGCVTDTVVVLIGAAVVVTGADVVVRTGAESVGVDRVADVRVPTAPWLPPPHEVRANAVATPNMAVAMSVNALAAPIMLRILRSRRGVAPHPAGMSG